MFAQNAFCVEIYSEKNKFGLKDNENIITKAEYQKLIQIGENGYIAQKNNKFGIIDIQGNVLVKLKYRNVERFFGKYAKLGNDKDFGMYDEYGNIIIEPKYTMIEPLFGKKFLTKKNFKYGVCDENGKILLANKYDEIYMPKPNIMRIKYGGVWYEIEKKSKNGEESLISGSQQIDTSVSFTITEQVLSGYSVVSATDYVLKLFSSISPAYEDTIDELMLSKGIDTINIFVKLSWLPKFPIVYIKNYYNNFVTPTTGPLSDIKDEIKRISIEGN